MVSHCPSEAKGALVSCQPHSWCPMVPHLYLLAGDQPHKHLQAITRKQKSPFSCPLVKRTHKYIDAPTLNSYLDSMIEVLDIAHYY